VSGADRLRRAVSVALPARRRPRTSRGWSACYAPHASMYFDQHGVVRACCQNTAVPLGDVRTTSLREIWSSPSAEQLRSALERDDYGAGCEFCGWEVERLGANLLFARGFDHLQPTDHRPEWPTHAEFALTNTCNLQCTMCDGDLSSAIRSQREGRPPLPEVYGDEFFEQLEPFLPHLRHAKLLGGEPFLGRPSMRLLERLAELDDPPEVTITTNGTIATPRVVRIIEALRPRLNVSIDGATAETFARIRVGAQLDEVLANLDRFVELVGTDRVSIATCFMRSNRHEFADLLLMAEERDVFVGVNVVRFPEVESVYALPPIEIRRTIDQLRAQRPRLTRSRRRAWEGQLTSLEHHLASTAEDHTS
jgi:MoaA/NifB/PqqE/SkfB family radical SAM enzyme